MRPMQQLASSLLLTAAAVCLPAHAKSDAEFMKEAAHAGAAEIEASRLAVAKSRTAAVKDFANTMITDHNKVANELKALAASKNVTLPEGPSMAQKAQIKLIDAGDNDKFDERYARNFGVKAHEDTIKLFEDAAANAQDGDVKAWAQKTLPGLKHHLEMARAMPAAKP